MPLTGEAKKAYMVKYHAEKKIEEKEKQDALEILEKCKALDDKKQYAPGEFSNWIDLFKIFHGENPKNDPDAKLKDKEEIITPSQHLFQDQKLSFDDWIEKRRLYRLDLWLLMQLRGSWNEQAHKPLADFFVRKDNSTLAFEYDQDEKNDWLRDQDEQHTRLLLYPRGFRKSTVSILDLVQWILNCPDIIVLVVPSTKRLGKLFIGELRGYFTIKDPRRPTQFQILFPEFCVPEGKGKKSGDVREFWCPLRHLNLKDPTVSFSSMESGSAGCRADIIRFDDAVDDINYKEPESRLTILAKFDQTRELIVPPFGYWDAVGTRYTDGLRDDSEEGPVPDMYGTILKRNLDDEAQSLKILIGAAWTVLSEFEDVPYKQLKPEMVTLLSSDPKGPGSFKVLMGKCRDNEPQFRSQQLNQPVAELNDEESYINTFTDDNIRKAQKDPSWVTTIQGPVRRYLFVDTAMTAGRKSDYSAFAVAQIEERGEDQPPIIWWLEIRADRYPDQRVAEIIAELMSKWNCGAYVEEIPSTSTTFKNEVNRQRHMKACQDLPFIWFTPDQQPAAKETRIRGLQLLHEHGLLRFVIGPWIDLMIKQLTSYTGHKSRKKYVGGRKDDIPDAMSYVYKVLPYIPGVMSESQKIEQEEREKKSRQSAEYDRIFGSQILNSSSLLNKSTSEPEPMNPIHRTLALIPQRQGPQLSFNRSVAKE